MHVESVRIERMWLRADHVEVFMERVSLRDTDKHGIPLGLVCLLNRDLRRSCFVVEAKKSIWVNPHQVVGYFAAERAEQQISVRRRA
jgi:hypothetical protein